MKRGRQKMSRKGSKKHFTHNALKTHVKNLPHTVMRGGIRL